MRGYGAVHLYLVAARLGLKRLGYATRFGWGQVFELLLWEPLGVFVSL